MYLKLIEGIISERFINCMGTFKSYWKPHDQVNGSRIPIKYQPSLALLHCSISQSALSFTFTCLLYQHEGLIELSKCKTTWTLEELQQANTIWLDIGWCHLKIYWWCLYLFWKLSWKPSRFDGCLSTADILQQHQHSFWFHWGVERHIHDYTLTSSLSAQSQPRSHHYHWFCSFIDWFIHSGLHMVGTAFNTIFFFFVYFFKTPQSNKRFKGKACSLYPMSAYWCWGRERGGRGVCAHNQSLFRACFTASGTRLA